VLGPKVEEALRRSGVVWLSFDGGPSRAAWHVWHDGAVHVVTGGGEQRLPGADGATGAVVAVRGKGARSGVVAEWAARVERVQPATPLWDAVAPLLAASRLNAADAAGQVERWARDSLVLRLRPEGPV
jgi:hypothetical protein